MSIPFQEFCMILFWSSLIGSIRVNISRIRNPNGAIVRKLQVTWGLVTFF